jgi:hypothetical protein
MSDNNQSDLQKILNLKNDTNPDPLKKDAIPTHVFIQYVGKSCLVAVGPTTKTQYTFETPGAIVPVDRRDQDSLLAIPQLRLVDEDSLPMNSAPD